MDSILHYDDYRLFLHDLIKSKKSHNSSLSLRAIAALIDLSPSYLSRIISSQRNLSVENAGKIARFTKMSSDENEYFHFLIEVGNSSSEIDRELLKSGLKDRDSAPVRMLTLEQFKIVADWYHFAILSLASTKAFRSDSRWIANRLGISIAESESGIERLIQFGFLKKVSGILKPVPESLQTPHDIPSHAVRSNHKQHLEIAIRSLDGVGLEFREFTNRTLNMNISDIPEAKRRIRKFVDRFNKDMDRPKGEEVFQINLQMYPLSKIKESVI